MREVLNHYTHNHLLNYKINLTLTQTLKNLCKKRVHGIVDFHNLSFWNTLNKTYEGIMCESKIRIAYIKKHVYKERK